MRHDALQLLAAAAATLERGRVDTTPLDLDTKIEKHGMSTRTRLKKQASLHVRLKIPRTPVVRDSADELIGKILWKKFLNESGKPKWYQGEVVSVCHVKRHRFVHSIGAGVTSSVKYTVLYDDGDSEDMTRDQVLKYLVK